MVALRSAVDTGKIDPRPYQWLCYAMTGNAIRNYKGPAFITASVGAGKTIMIAMVAARFSQMGYEGMIIARQGEIIDQDAEELWNLNVKNSLFSASLGRRVRHTRSLSAAKERLLMLYSARKRKRPPWVISHRDFCLLMNAIRLTGRMLGTTSIKGPFWSGGEIVNIDTKYLVDLGFLVPTIFGVPDIEELKYDLHDFESNGEDGAQDYTESQLKAMQEEIIKQGTLTQKIMLKVMELTRNRNGVLITCAGKKHCKEAAKYLPDGSYAIVTDDMGQKMRRKALKDAYTGKIKYVLQIGCLTTGVNIPLWDTSVILRKIMSLTLLVQLLGRGMRLLKSEQVDQGLVKEDHLVLDFTGTMFELGALYDDPILEEAELQRSKRSGEEVPCPKCATLNSPYARRCIGEDKLSPDGRCEEFFQLSAVWIR
ncbi:hypothetical protein GH714_044120 [Hevea brasiliensis]|uniref:Helicase C-terminal domain-containing protein n=1 Tax=Hevea brasiliensis TaxID=3981 RepID=A0A6A6K1V8_HEVBR|nr:hypothetical protein GH714_044120 [Hevea brasiliensis]